MKTSLVNVLVLLIQLAGPVQTWSFVDHKFRFIIVIAYTYTTKLCKCRRERWLHFSVLFIRERCYANMAWRVANSRTVELYGLCRVIMRETRMLAKWYRSKMKARSELRVFRRIPEQRSQHQTMLFFMRTEDALAEKLSHLWLQGQWCYTHL